MASPSRAAHLLAWVAAVAVMIALLLWPAIWNGFPVVFQDTGGYLARPFEGTLLMGRSAFYGGFLALGIGLDFWPNVMAQSALAVWIILLTLRAQDVALRPLFATATVAALSALTGLPWYVSQLMPDILAPCAILALHLLAFRIESLRRWEIAALVFLFAAAAASHMAILALGLALLAVLALWRIAADRFGGLRPRLAMPAIAILAGLLLAPLSNWALAKRFALTPGGINFVFGRLVQDGIVQRYLSVHCPADNLAICAHRDRLAGLSADDWLWDQPSPLFDLGGAEAFAAEARHIVWQSVLEFPALHVRTAIAAAISQFVRIETGEGLTDWNPHVEWIFERYAPHALLAYRASRQAHREFDFALLNAVHVPVAFASFALMAMLLITRRRRRDRPAGAALVGVVTIALIGNAAVCGILSNPHDRYQSRLIWLSPLALIAVMASGRKRLS